MISTPSLTRALLVQLLPCCDVTPCLAFVRELELKIGNALFDVSNKEKVPNRK
jgi:hypothetical protein